MNTSLRSKKFPETLTSFLILGTLLASSLSAGVSETAVGPVPVPAADRVATVQVRVALDDADWTCPPTSMFAAYNEITAPKSLTLLLEAGRSYPPEQYDATRAWVSRFLQLE
ncbi:MAG TPA: acetylxylan esterase [Opitutaceae bacterium]